MSEVPLYAGKEADKKRKRVSGGGEEEPDGASERNDCTLPEL